jgi:ABC-2 type transport system permease protein
VLYNEGRPEQVQVGLTIIREALNRMTLQAAGVQPLFTLSTESVTSRSFSYIDFLVPGVVAMSIMQLGLFSVAFGFVQLRQRGILRRLWATPVQPRSFLFAQVVTRLAVSVLQSLLLIGIAVLFFDVQIVGNLLGILVLAVLGGAVFLTMGFAIAGRAKNENVAAPLANIVALPMMFLSGVFFGRDAMPEALKTVTSYLPLTYLADGMRAISTQGATLWSQWPAMLGLGVWLVVSFAVATRLFKWE